MKNRSTDQMIRKWRDSFTHIPSQNILGPDHPGPEDSSVSIDREMLSLVASPAIECEFCFGRYTGDLSLAELSLLTGAGHPLSCTECEEGEGYRPAWPSDDFPYVEGDLFVPGPCRDRLWMNECADRIAKLGFHVFRHPSLGIALFVEGDGFDDRYWVPLHALKMSL